MTDTQTKARAGRKLAISIAARPLAKEIERSVPEAKKVLDEAVEKIGKLIDGENDANLRL